MLYKKILLRSNFSTEFDKMSVLKFFFQVLRKTSVPYSTIVSAYDFIKKEASAQVYLCEYFEILKNTFVIEYFRETASIC